MYYKNYNKYFIDINQLIKKLPEGISNSIFIYFYDSDTEYKDILSKINEKNTPYKAIKYEFHNSNVEFNSGDIYDIQRRLL